MKLRIDLHGQIEDVEYEKMESMPIVKEMSLGETYFIKSIRDYSFYCARANWLAFRRWRQIRRILRQA